MGFGFLWVGVMLARFGFSGGSLSALLVCLCARFAFAGRFLVVLGWWLF